MRLTREERKAILAGDHKALRRDREPQIEAGEVIVLAWSRGGKQVLYRNPREVEQAVASGNPITAEIPRKPTIWIELQQPIRHKDGGWAIQFEFHDEREPVRRLAPVPGPPTEAGLKTRWRDPEDVPKRGEQIEAWTPESERGYGGSRRTAVDEAVGVDDEALKRFAMEGRKRLTEHRAEEVREGEVRRHQEQAIMRRLREALQGLNPAGQITLLAAIEKRIEVASLETSDIAA